MLALPVFQWGKQKWSTKTKKLLCYIKHSCHFISFATGFFLSFCSNQSRIEEIYLRHACCCPFGPFRRKNQSDSNLGGKRRSFLCWSSLDPLWKGIIFEFALFKFNFGRYFVEYGRTHGGLSLRFNLSTLPLVFTTKLHILVNNNSKIIFIWWLWTGSLCSSILRLRLSKMAKKDYLIRRGLFHNYRFLYLAGPQHNKKNPLPPLWGFGHLLFFRSHQW